MSETRAPREANFELLRVAAMLMVMLWHALGHGGVLRQYAFGSAGYFLFSGLRWMSSVAVNAFVLLTGYFMVESRFRLSRCLRLLVQVWTYSVLSLLAVRLLFGRTASLRETVYAFFPTTSWIYWFASDYMALLILSPALNAALRAMSRKRCAAAALALLALLSLAPTVFPWSRGWLGDGYGVGWFVALYCAAAFLRLHGDTLFDRFPAFRGARAPLALYLALTWGCALLRLAFGYAHVALFGAPAAENWQAVYNLLPVFLASVSLFLLFRNLRVRSARASRIAVSLGSVCFGAYLLTDHDLIREPLWAALSLPKLCGRGLPAALAGTLGTALLLFAVGCLFEAARVKLMAALRLPELLAGLDARAERLRAHFFGS